MIFDRNLMVSDTVYLRIVSDYLNKNLMVSGTGCSSGGEKWLKQL